MDTHVRRYLSDLVDVARHVLGDNLVGAYAAGSLGLHAYQPGRSDIDVALICADPLTEEGKRSVSDQLSDPEPD